MRKAINNIKKFKKMKKKKLKMKMKKRKKKILVSTNLLSFQGLQKIKLKNL